MMYTFVSQVKERFTQTKNYFQKFGVLLSLADLSPDNLNEVKLLEKCNASAENLRSNISGFQVKIKIVSFLNLPVFKEEQCSPMDCLKYIVEHHLIDCCTNLYAAFRIVLTMLMSVASAERSFSKLQLIKTYL